MRIFLLIVLAVSYTLSIMSADASIDLSVNDTPVTTTTEHMEELKEEYFEEGVRVGTVNTTQLVLGLIAQHCHTSPDVALELPNGVRLICEVKQ